MLAASNEPSALPVLERGTTEERTASFIAAMDHNARGRAEGVVKAVGVNDARHMLDLGGGSGAFSIAFAKAAPQLRGEILDLPDVQPIAQEYLRRAGVADRISVRAGDMLPLPRMAARSGSGNHGSRAESSAHVIDRRPDRSNTPPASPM